MTSTPLAVRHGLAALLLVGLASPARSQAAGNNFSLLHNGMDVTYAGLGAGSGTAASDGMGTWIHGEDLRGARLTSLGDFGHRMNGFVENVCVLGPNPGAGGALGGLAVVFPNVAFVEFDGRNGHRPDVFRAPACTAGGVPTGVGYGVPFTPGVGASSASFLFASYPTSMPGLPTAGVLLPNGGLQPSGHGGTATFVANTGLFGLFITSTGFCWQTAFQWLPSAIPLNDDIDGLWHYAHTSPDDNQYWGMSNNEINAWHSFSVARVGAGLMTFSANLDYALVLTSPEPQTHAALQPAALGGSVYETTTVGAAGGNPGVPAAGFDLGRHGAWSQSGLGGTGLQDPAGGPFPAAVPSVGFATFNNANYGGGFPPPGGWRLTWVTIDFDVIAGSDPALAGEATVLGGSVRVPSPIPAAGGPWPQPITVNLFPTLVHDTANFGWPNPYGAGGPLISGTSLHLPFALGSVCIGVPVAIAFGTSGLLGPAGPLTWNPNVNATSDSRQLYILN